MAIIFVVFCDYLSISPILLFSRLIIFAPVIISDFLLRSVIMSCVVQTWSCSGGEMLPGEFWWYKKLVGLYTVI